MADVNPSREEAFSLLEQYNKNKGLIKHALAVEAVMCYCAKKQGEEFLGYVDEAGYTRYLIKKGG